MKQYELTREKYLNDEELTRLNEILDKYKYTEPRNCTLLWLALHTGARPQEILNLQAEDLDPHSKTIRIKTLKNNVEREVPLQPWLFKRVLELKVKSGKLFPISYSRYMQIWHEYRPIKKALHCLRHTFAINLYKKSKDVRAVQLCMGHRNWNTTMIYAAYHYKTTELRKLVLSTKL